MHTATQRPILVIEDDHDDFEVIRSAIEAEGLGHRLYRIVFGPDALDYLLRRMGHQKHAGEPLPALILMDLHLPGIDGRELLAELHSHKALRHIPVVVVSGEADDYVVGQCYDAGAHGFISKPMGSDDLVQSLRIALRYWTRVVDLPTPEAPAA